MNTIILEKFDNTHNDFPALGPRALVHPTATVIDSRLGAWTEVGADTTIIESSLSDYSYVAAHHAHIMYATIGKFTSVASHVRINPSNHPMHRVTQHHCTYRRRQYGFGTHDDDSIFEWRKSRAVTIGHDVWIGHGAIILPGVTIENGAVIGAGSVVSKDIPPYHVAVGSPAKAIRTRFDVKTIQALEDIAWWHWDHPTLQERFDDLLDPQLFIEKYGNRP